MRTRKIYKTRSLVVLTYTHTHNKCVFIVSMMKCNVEYTRDMALLFLHINFISLGTLPLVFTFSSDRVLCHKFYHVELYSR